MIIIMLKRLVIKVNMYRAQNEAYKIEKTKKWEKSMNDRELER
jgi:hypothetical protein